MPRLTALHPAAEAGDLPALRALVAEAPNRGTEAERKGAAQRLERLRDTNAPDIMLRDAAYAADPRRATLRVSSSARGATMAHLAELDDPPSRVLVASASLDDSAALNRLIERGAQVVDIVVPVELFSEVFVDGRPPTRARFCQ
jgi:hypothetical protein